jgi:Ca2+-binding RTX toxin-like protein
MKTALLSIAVVAVAGAPGVASAATVSSDGTTAVYRAAPREANALVLAPSFPFAVVDLGAPLTAGPGCVDGTPITCAGQDFQALLGDRADTADVNNVINDVVIDAGSGDDDVTAGSVGRVTVTGAEGDDTLRVNANGLGIASGGRGADRVLGTSGGNQLTGGEGADLVTNRQRFGSSLLDGGDGADRLVGTGGATLLGGNGGDILVARNDGETLDGGAGADLFASQAGGSTITGGAGADVISAADGSGLADTIDCGGGFDVVWADEGDTVAANCELRRSGPAPALPGVDQAVADAEAL